MTGSGFDWDSVLSRSSRSSGALPGSGEGHHLAFPFCVLRIQPNFMQQQLESRCPRLGPWGIRRCTRGEGLLPFSPSPKAAPIQRQIKGEASWPRQKTTSKGHPSSRAPEPQSPGFFLGAAQPSPLPQRVESTPSNLESSPKITKQVSRRAGIQIQIHLTLSPTFPATLSNR